MKVYFTDDTVLSREQQRFADKAVTSTEDRRTINMYKT